MKKKVSIYYIYDPISKLPLYVGCTSGPLSLRLGNHLSCAKNCIPERLCKSTLERYKRYVSLIKNKTPPTIHLIESVPIGLASAKEDAYNNLFKELGIEWFRLVSRSEYSAKIKTIELNKQKYEQWKKSH